MDVKEFLELKNELIEKRNLIWRAKSIPQEVARALIEGHVSPGTPEEKMLLELDSLWS